MILLGALLAVAVGINCKLRVREALSNIGENKPKNNGNGNTSKKTAKSKFLPQISQCSKIYGNQRLGNLNLEKTVSQHPEILSLSRFYFYPSP